MKYCKKAIVAKKQGRCTLNVGGGGGLGGGGAERGADAQHWDRAVM